MHTFSCYADSELDSLKGVWKNEQLDIDTRMDVLSKISEKYYSIQPDSAFYYGDLLYRAAKEKGQKILMGNALNIKGVSKDILGQYDSADIYYKQSLKLMYEIGSASRIAAVLNNVGLLNQSRGNFGKAASNFFSCIRVYVKVHDLEGVSDAVNNLGNLCLSQGLYDKAGVYYRKGYELAQQTENKESIAISLSNLGLITQEMGDLDSALNYFQESLTLCLETRSGRGAAEALNNMAYIYFVLEDPEKALECCYKALEIYEEMEAKYGIASTNDNIGTIFFEVGNYQESIRYGQISMDIASEIGSVTRIINTSELLYKNYNALGQYEKALSMHVQYNELKDSVDNALNDRAIIEQQYKHEYERERIMLEARHRSETKLKALKTQTRDARQRLVIWLTLVGVLVLAVFLFFVFNRLKLTRRQKNEINHQKEVIEASHRDIMDSIVYAKHLQQAMFPKKKHLNNCFPDNFILFKPKSTISGDFYWVSKNGQFSYVAVGDCTGHGVPGAMVSVVCSNALHRTVNEFGIFEPAKVLDKVREIVVRTFAKSEQGVNDGMDVVFCAVKGNHLTFAGANNSIWVVRKTAELPEEEGRVKILTVDGYSLIEYKGDRQHVGYSRSAKEFNQKEIELMPDDRIYLFSDGYADQFGGEKGKKLKVSALKRIILQLQSASMEDQKQTLLKAFDDWKGSYEQVDDVCIMGIRVT